MKIISENELFKKLLNMEKYRLKKYGKTVAAITVLNKLMPIIVIESETLNSEQGAVLKVTDGYIRAAQLLFK